MSDNFDSHDEEFEEYVDEPSEEPDKAEEWDDADEDEDPIADLLYEIVSRMGFSDFDIEWEERPDHTRYFVEGQDEIGALIGRHGVTLEALQYIVGVINSRKSLVEHKIIVDIQGYRERREEKLRRLANQMAKEAYHSGQEIILEPMPSSDRRVIHLALSSNPAVKTFSEGDEPDRCVVIAPRRERH